MTIKENSSLLCFPAKSVPRWSHSLTVDKEEASASMSMVGSTTEAGGWTNEKATASRLNLMGPYMRENGATTKKMGRAR